MTLQRMREELIRFIQYDGDYQETLPASFYNGLINDAYVEACGYLDIPEDVRSVPVATFQRRVPLNGLVKAYRAWWGTTSLRRERTIWENPLTDQGTPNAYEQVGSEILLYPIPDADGVLVVDGVWEPTQLISDNDVPIIPMRGRRAIVQLAYAAYLEPFGLSKRDTRALARAEAMSTLESLLRDLRASRWGDSRQDAVYPHSVWLRSDD